MVVGETSLWPYRLGIITAALLSMCGESSLAATTTYTGVWAGGTIAPNDTVVLDNGASVTGNVVANGRLQFNQSAPSVLTISRTITGTGALSLTNTGTLHLTGTSVAVNTVVLNLTTTASAGLLQVRSGTGILRVGSSGTGTLNVTGGRITNSEGYLGYTAGSVGAASVSSGTWANSSFLSVGRSGSGTLTITGGGVTGGWGYLGQLAGSVGTATVSGGTWANVSGLSVGQSGTGTLNVMGGSVTNWTGYVSVEAGSRGTATVRGPTVTTSLWDSMAPARSTSRAVASTTRMGI
jgi:T5SS/PEP-CTERM-associated repeat protein